MSTDQLLVTAGSVLLIAALWYYFFGPKQAAEARMAGNAQEVRITVKGGYSPDVIRVRQGVPLRLVFDRQENSECSSRVVFPDFKVSRSLVPFGTTILELAVGHHERQPAASLPAAGFGRAKGSSTNGRRPGRKGTVRS